MSQDSRPSGPNTGTNGSNRWSNGSRRLRCRAQQAARCPSANPGRISNARSGEVLESSPPLRKVAGLDCAELSGQTCGRSQSDRAQMPTLVHLRPASVTRSSSVQRTLHWQIPPHDGTGASANRIAQSRPFWVTGRRRFKARSQGLGRLWMSALISICNWCA